MKKIKISKKFKELCQKGTALVLACTMAGTMTSCSKKETLPTDIPVPAAIEIIAEDIPGLRSSSEYILDKYGVEDIENGDLDVHKFKYLVDFTKLIPEEYEIITEDKLCFYEGFDIKSISSELIDEKVGIADYYWGYSRTPAANNVILSDLVIPDCYSHYFAGSSENGKKCDLAIYKDMKWFHSEQLLVSPDYNNLKLVYNRAEVEKDVSKYAKKEYEDINISEDLAIGDVMESYSLYLIVSGEETLVGFIQTGAGSDSQNVQDKIFGDMPSMITTIEKSGIIETPVSLTSEEYFALKEKIKNSEINGNGVVVEKNKTYQKNK